MSSFEYQYDDHAVFIGEIAEPDPDRFEVKKFSIVTYIGNIDHDITTSVAMGSPKLFQLYKEDFLKKYLDSKG